MFVVDLTAQATSLSLDQVDLQTRAPSLEYCTADCDAACSDTINSWLTGVCYLTSDSVKLVAR